MTQPRFGHKLVSANEIRIDDRIFRATKVGGDLMMVLHEMLFEHRGSHSLLASSGPTYALNPSVVGEEITGAEMDEDSWTIPPEGMVTKVVPWAEADHG